MNKFKELNNRKLLSLAAIIVLLFIISPLVIPETLTIAAPTVPKSQNLQSNTTPKPDTTALNESKKQKVELNKKIEREKRIAEEKAERIRITRDYLAKFNSPMEPYAHVIVNAADRCGGDFKALIAIARIESGLGAMPYKKYNPYGYLNGVQYSGWESALDRLSCQISKQYLAVYGNNFEKIGSIYAANPNWAKKVSTVYYSI